MMQIKTALNAIRRFPSLVYFFITREKLFYPFLILTFLLLNLFFIGHRVRFIMLGDELNELNKELSVAISLNQRLESEAVQLSALPRIERFARDSCGMIEADRNNRIIVLWDKSEEMEVNKMDMIDKAVCSIQRKAEDILLPEEDFVKGF